jgi:hypothetical protein
LTEDESAIPTAEDVTGGPTIGEQTELTRDRGLVLGGEQPYRSLDLTFRLGSFTAGVLIFDNRDRDPDPATVAALAETLRQRIEAVLAGGGPGLGRQVIRLGRNVGLDFNDALYERRAGQTLAYLGETDEARAAREANYGGATDVYSVYQALVLGDGVNDDDPYYVARLYRFPDEAAAASWLAGLPARLPEENASYEEIVPDPAAPAFGDESVTLSYVFATSQTLVTNGFLIAVRVGPLVVRVQADSRPTADSSGVRRLAEAHLVCLTGGACPPVMEAPPAFLAARSPAPTPIDPV